MTWRKGCQDTHPVGRGLFRLSTKSALFFQFSGLLYNPFMALVKCLKHFFSKISNFSSLKIWRFCFFHPLFAAFFPQNAIRVCISAQNAPSPASPVSAKVHFLTHVCSQNILPAPLPRPRPQPVCRLCNKKPLRASGFCRILSPRDNFSVFILCRRSRLCYPFLLLFAFFAAFSASFAARSSE